MTHLTVMATVCRKLCFTARINQQIFITDVSQVCAVVYILSMICKGLLVLKTFEVYCILKYSYLSIFLILQYQLILRLVYL